MLILFLVVSVISFVGSIHPGTVNLAVVQTTLGHSRRAGLYLALGGSLPELVYSLLAVNGLMLLTPNAWWYPVLSYLPIPVLLLAGWAAFRQKPVALTNAPTSRSPFWKGMALASVNPQLLPFWSAVWLYLNQMMLVPTNSPASPWAFALGTVAGAFALLIGLVWTADRHRERIGGWLVGKRLNQVTGGLFVAMAVGQAVHVLT